MVQPLSLVDLRRRAESGDSRAQYEYAAACAAAGRREEADLFLRRAAANGEPDAYFTLATRLVQTKAGLGEAAALLKKSVDGGSMAAMRALAVLRADGLGAPADWSAALSLVLEAAKRGDVEAKRDLAGLLLLLDENDEDAAGLLAEASARDPVAGAVMVRRSIEGRADFAAAAALAQRLKGAGYSRAPALQDKLASLGKKRAEEPPAPDLTRIEKMLAVFAKSMRADAPPLDRPSQRAIAREAVLVSPAAYVVRGFVAPEILEYMMALAARRLLPSMTFDPETGVPRRDDYRTSRTATLGPMDQDLTLVAVNQLLARIAGLPHARAEFLSVLKYDPGEEYRPHFDWIPPSGRDFNASGQRIRTALLYLNDDYEGGETHFLAPDFRFRGAPGDVLVFSNVGADGAPDQASRHASLPIRSGAKWLASKWFRERDFVF